jgi:hypothetical protein
MRVTAFVTGLSLALWIILAAATASLRWFGQQRLDTTFPMPSDDGCWQQICFFYARVEELPQILNAHPDILPGSAHFADDRAPGTSFPLQFTYAPGGFAPQAVWLYWTPQSYELMRAQQNPTRPPLARLGDVIRVLGPPERLSLETSILLDYPARGVKVIVQPEDLFRNRLRLTPDDAVTSVFVVDARVSGGGGVIYYPPTMAWHGFGLYDFPP